MVRGRCFVFEAMAKKYPELEYKAVDAQGEKSHFAFFNCLIDEKGIFFRRITVFASAGPTWAERFGPICAAA